MRKCAPRPFTCCTGPSKRPVACSTTVRSGHHEGALLAEGDVLAEAGQIRVEARDQARSDDGAGHQLVYVPGARWRCCRGRITPCPWILRTRSLHCSLRARDPLGIEPRRDLDRRLPVDVFPSATKMGSGATRPV
jgi:hypothetical protein